MDKELDMNFETSKSQQPGMTFGKSEDKEKCS